MGQGSSRPDDRRPSRLHRASTAISMSIPSIFTRRSSRSNTTIPRPRPSSIGVFPSISRPRPRPGSSTRDDTHRYTLPNLQVPALDLDFNEMEAPEAMQSRSLSPSPSARRPERRASSFITDRMSALRPLRRRRSPHRREEDQAAMLSRLLSVAAAATAASLMGEDPRTASETRNFAGDDEDGTFDSFLQALQNGRIASALRGENVSGDGTGTGGMQAPLNFFRMFRFGSNNNARRIEGPQESEPAGENDGDGRMVPIIIVGIRSINPGSGSSQDENIPPFLDALSTFPSPVITPGDRESAVDGLLRQTSAPTTRFSHRRRASMGGFPANYDSQRHHPRPPPSTPSSGPFSALSSGTTTPTMNSTTAAPSAAPSRRDSFARRPPVGLETTSEEPAPHRTPRQRRLSESDFTPRFGSGSSRRNGVVEPDHNPGEGSRSWIIYVLGGSYPENHPILTTPSLFTDSPTYEDMVLLSALLGPAKPPVASEAEVAAASGLYRINMTAEGSMVAEPVAAEPAIEPNSPEISIELSDGTAPDQRVPQVEPVTPQPAPKCDTSPQSADQPSGDGAQRTSSTILIAADQRCLVCLGEYEVGEEARQLLKCEHLFHKECIDHWLLNGRNSCPLCRRQGVGEDDETHQQDAATQTMNDGNRPHWNAA